MNVTRLATSPARFATRWVRRGVGTAAEQMVGTPEAARVIEAAAASPLPEQIARSMSTHHVFERVADQVVADGELEAAMVRTLESEAMQRLLERAIAGPVRAALTAQSTTFVDELISQLRTQASSVDATAERIVGRRAPASQYGGIASRGLALVLDITTAVAAALAACAAVGIVALLAGPLRRGWLVGGLAGGIVWLAVATYLVSFWTLGGQTPWMRVVGLRVLGPDGRPPGLGRSLVRLLGLILAIVPLFAGFLPILFDDRRRGLQDYIAGTVVTTEMGASADDPPPG